jgi:hypothetical protein
LSPLFSPFFVVLFISLFFVVVVVGGVGVGVVGVVACLGHPIISARTL